MNRAHPSFQHGQAVAKIARGEPGAWVELAIGLTTQQADGKVYRVRREPSGAFRPRGSFDARKQRCDDGTTWSRSATSGGQTRHRRRAMTAEHDDEERKRLGSTR
jgi:hypothetical protein